MPATSETRDNRDSGLETEKSVDSKFLDEDSGGLIPRLHAFLRKNLNDIILFTILISLTIINFFIEAKLTSPNFFYIVILITGYSLGKRFAVLAALLTILVMWMFILADKSPYLAHNTKQALTLHMTIWGGFLILTGWLGSFLAKIFHKETSTDLFISPSAAYPRESDDKSSKR